MISEIIDILLTSEKRKNAKKLLIIAYNKLIKYVNNVQVYMHKQRYKDLLNKKWTKILSIILCSILVVSSLLFGIIYIFGYFSISRPLHTTLASFYDTGFILSKDSLKAIRMYTVDAENGYAPAQYYLAYRYLQEIKYKENKIEGTKWLDSAVSKKFGPAIIYKGKELIDKKKYESAISYLDSITYLGYKSSGLLDGLIFKYIHSIIFYRFYEFRRKSHLAVAYYYNRNYENFICIARNIANNKNTIQIAYALGELLKNDTILSKYNLTKYYSINESKHWYNIAFKKGEKRAGLGLAELYCGENNDEVAEKIYEKLANEKYIPAIIQLSRMYRKAKTYRPIFKEKSINILKDISNISGEACYELGNIFFNSPNNDLAYTYFFKADSLNFENSFLCSILSEELYRKNKYKESIQMLKKGLKYTHNNFENWNNSDYFDWICQMGQNALFQKDTTLCINSYKLHYQYTRKSETLIRLFHINGNHELGIGTFKISENTETDSVRIWRKDNFIDCSDPDKGFYMELACLYSHLMVANNYQETLIRKRYALLYLEKALKCNGKYPFIFFTNTVVALTDFFTENKEFKDLKKLSILLKQIKNSSESDSKVKKTI